MSNEETMTETMINVKDKYIPRDYQLPIIEAVLAHCKKSAEPAFIDISVGGGKLLFTLLLPKLVSLRVVK